MAFFTESVGTLGTIVTAIGALFLVCGLVNLAEGYGSDNPGAKSQGGKQVGAGAGIIFIAVTLIPKLAGIF